MGVKADHERCSILRNHQERCLLALCSSLSILISSLCVAFLGFWRSPCSSHKDLRQSLTITKIDSKTSYDSRQRKQLDNTRQSDYSQWSKTHIMQTMSHTKFLLQDFTHTQKHVHHQKLTHLHPNGNINPKRKNENRTYYIRRGAQWKALHK
jgi:hypothetical protein